jgi:hypothetical protein
MADTNIIDFLSYAVKARRILLSVGIGLHRVPNTIHAINQAYWEDLGVAEGLTAMIESRNVIPISNKYTKAFYTLLHESMSQTGGDK